jgi:membrane protease YdiL (CAAX protease family)
VKGVWITAIIGAIIFGLTHASNIFYGMEPLAVLAQVISATFVGLLFGAVYLRSGSLWAPILVHTLTDIAGLAPSTFLRNLTDVDSINRLSFSWLSLLFDLLYLALAVFLLRPSKCKQVYQNLCFAQQSPEEAK